MASTALTVGGSQLSLLLHTHPLTHPTLTQTTHTSLTKASNWSHLRWQVHLPPPPALTSGPKGHERKAAENQGEGWAEEGRGPSLRQPPRRYPINQSFTVQLRIPGAQRPT